MEIKKLTYQQRLANLSEKSVAISRSANLSAVAIDQLTYHLRSARRPRTVEQLINLSVKADQLASKHLFYQLKTTRTSDQ